MTKKVNKNISFTYEINKSKFICILCPFSNFEKTMNQLRLDHPKARHFVYAYRYYNEFDQIVENQSDDGEPKGSSGPPVLSVLRGEELVNTAAIVVRYFGGVKLGVGGLVRAYGKSVHLALEEAKAEKLVEKYVKLIESSFKIKIQNLNKLDHFLKHYQDIVVEREFLGVEVNLLISSSSVQAKEIKNYIEENMLE